MTRIGIANQAKPNGASGTKKFSTSLQFPADAKGAALFQAKGTFITFYGLARSLSVIDVFSTQI